MILFVLTFDLSGSPFQKPISGGTLASMISCLAVLFSSAPEEAHLSFDPAGYRASDTKQ
jgi:hypothetical protein